MNSRILYAASALCFAASAACFTMGGYLMGKRQAEKEFDARLEMELRVARKYYAKLSKRDEFASPTGLVSESHEDPRPKNSASERIRPSSVEEVGSRKEDVEDRTEYFDYRREIPKRSPEVPYVISYDEFFENPKDYDQRTLTYFSKDDVVVEERDAPIDDVLGILGPVALEQFGNGSKDPNIVYVRNDRLAMDFEVCWDPDSFEETVLGQIKHSENPKVRKFRLDDD